MIRQILSLALLPCCLMAALPRVAAQAPGVRVRLVEHRPKGADEPALRPGFSMKIVDPAKIEDLLQKGTLLHSADSDVSWKLPGGGYISNVEDLGRFGQALVQGKLLKPDSYGLLWTSQRIREGNVTHYGMGFSLQEWQGRMLVGHGGAQDNTRTQLLLDPRRGHVIAFMTNSEWATQG